MLLSLPNYLHHRTFLDLVPLSKSVLCHTPYTKQRKDTGVLHGWTKTRLDEKLWRRHKGSGKKTGREEESSVHWSVGHIQDCRTRNVSFHLLCWGFWPWGSDNSLTLSTLGANCREWNAASVGTWFAPGSQKSGGRCVFPNFKRPTHGPHIGPARILTTFEVTGSQGQRYPPSAQGSGSSPGGKRHGW